MKLFLSILQKLALAVLLAPMIAAIFYLTIPLGNTRATHFDTLLVLGYPALSDGSPSPEERERVAEAVRQYRAGVAPTILFTGGAAHNRFVEARVMLRLAESMGVPRSALLEEDYARDTLQNIEYSTSMMKARGWQSAEVITSPSHQRRASLILMHSPIGINWRMQAAAWPPEEKFLERVGRYALEALACTEMRLAGFHESILREPGHPATAINSLGTGQR